MSVLYPYSLSYFADDLIIQSVVWDVQRNDAMSGQGSGRIITAELAPPLWIGTVGLTMMSLDKARQVAAKIRKLHGAQEAIFIYDPMSKFPQNDPRGHLLQGRSFKVDSIASDRAGLKLSGLFPGFTLLPGDKMSMQYAVNPPRYAFLEVSESATAGASGITPEFGVFPHVPVGLAAGTSVDLIKPACKCIVLPGSHNPGTGQKTYVEGAGFKVIQKK